MSNQYRSNSSLSSLLKLLGATFALILLIGALDKAGVKVIMGDKPAGNAYESSMLPRTTERAAEEHSDYAPPRTPERYRRSAAREAAAPDWEGLSATDIDNFLDQFAATARKQALENGVPAGIALAYGIEELKRGQRIDSWDAFQEKVTAPLSRLKQEVPRDALGRYFKYSANSQRWAQGLGRYSRHSEQQLMSNLQHFNLEAEDEAVTEILLQQPEDASRVQEVADEVTAKIVRRQNKGHRRQTEAEQTPETGTKAWRNFYEEEVGQEVAKEIARKKLRSGQYIGEDDMEALIEETNQETEATMQSNIGLLGRKINRGHQNAGQKLDITDPRNAQAREELYQKKLREQGYVKGHRK
ncbi:MAG: hypothetical protein ACE362_08690 [Phaeodactylibacter xiamenensis]|uniref:Uncharacterized protein n=1 Tax=Phaeodactylibacter xiamenensis TaxID=1524460 RepID=A0A098S7I4_9BACT|nr:hypothetical protein [Phaeodactylibacter xiamenensis]KGE88529.1 hypothetical protein IX84_07555 [Phaeodactylibacter xiamenensis]MCR9054422.1 hypothetical protein [bacterium]